MSFASQGRASPQLAAAVLATDATTTSASFVDLLSSTFTVGGAVTAQTLGVATISTSLAAVVAFQFLLDGTAVGVPHDLTVALGASVPIMLLVPSMALSAGSHTLKLQWKTTLGTARCRPVTANEGASFSLMSATT